jgi:hypothetical protein
VSTSTCPASWASSRRTHAYLPDPLPRRAIR